MYFKTFLLLNLFGAIHGAFIHPISEEATQAAADAASLAEKTITESSLADKISPSLEEHVQHSENVAHVPNEKLWEPTQGWPDWKNPPKEGSPQVVEEAFAHLSDTQEDFLQRAKTYGLLKQYLSELPINNRQLTRLLQSKSFRQTRNNARLIHNLSFGGNSPDSDEVKVLVERFLNLKVKSPEAVGALKGKLEAYSLEKAQTLSWNDKNLVNGMRKIITDEHPHVVAIPVEGETAITTATKQVNAQNADASRAGFKGSEEGDRAASKGKAATVLPDSPEVDSRWIPGGPDYELLSRVDELLRSRGLLPHPEKENSGGMAADLTSTREETSHSYTSTSGASTSHSEPKAENLFHHEWELVPYSPVPHSSETDSSRIAKPNHELIYRTAKILGNHEPLSRVIRPSIFNHWLTVPTKNLNEIQREKKIAGEPLDVVLKYRDHLKLRHASDWFMKKAKENREKSPAYQRIKWNP